LGLSNWQMPQKTAFNKAGGDMFVVASTMAG
jgi:hypothetical protein